MSKRGKLPVLVAVTALALGATPAAAKELRVDDDQAQCPTAPFTSIQAAVTAASPGDKVKVCPGTYTEQVRITNKDGLKLESLADKQAIIQFPVLTTAPNALVHIQSSDDVSVRGFVIRGPYVEAGCTIPQNNHFGVYVDNSFNAEIRDNHITLIRNSLPSLFGCQDGLAVLVGRQSLGSVGSADVNHNLIDEYQKGGVVTDNAGSFVQVDHNTIRVTSLQVQASLAPNGVQISRGAGGRVDHNDVSGNSFLGDPNSGSGSGILLFQPGAGLVRVDHNNVFANDDGIPSIDSDNNEVSHNTSHDNVLYDGLYFDSASTGNLVLGNNAFGNTEHDCHDDSNGTGTAGTANTWKANDGDTQNRPGLCDPATVQ